MMHIIRPMIIADIDAVYSIETTAHKTPWSKEILRDCVLVGYDCRVIEVVNEDSKTLAGYIISRVSTDLYHILNICIDKSLQSQGLGRYLLTEVLHSLSDSRPGSCMVLEVRPSNTAALNLYYSMGFEQVDIKPGYYKDLNDVEDAILLKKNIVGF